eukprot:15352537-Ditylum_brightwellii.AAC.1
MPGFVWPCATPKENGRLGAKLQDTSKMSLDVPQPKWLVNPTHQTKRNLCGTWCKCKTLTIEQKEKQQQYYYDVEKDVTLYKQLTGAVVEFVTKEYLLESYHPFDSQTNEAMNMLVMKHAPKNKTLCKRNWCSGVGYEKFRRVVRFEFEIDVGNGVEKYLCSMDK